MYAVVMQLTGYTSLHYLLSTLHSHVTVHSLRPIDSDAALVSHPVRESSDVRSRDAAGASRAV
jgi:hypothetical protein